MKLTLALILTTILLCTAICAQTSSRTVSTRAGLTTDDVKRFIQRGIPPEILAQIIARTPSEYNLTTGKIQELQSAGLPAMVIDAMLKASRSSTSIGAPPPAPTKLNGPPRPANINPAAGNPSPGTGTTVGSNPPAGSGQEELKSSAPDQDLQRAKVAEIGPGSWVEPKKQSANCPQEPQNLQKIDLYYESGSSSASRLDKSGMYCFAVKDANPLFDWAITMNVVEPMGNPFDLIAAAIDALKPITGGGKEAASAPAKVAEKAPRPCPFTMDGVTKKSTALTNALSNISPKDSSGKVLYVNTATTQAAMSAVTAAFTEYETAIRDLQITLKTGDLSGCGNLVTQAENVILQQYPKVRKDYQDLVTRLSRPDVQYYERQLSPTSSADLVVTPSYSGTALTAKTYHFDPSFGILSSSAGFVLTTLQARSYSSATAPDPSDPTKTQNVLKVDYGTGIRPALVVLLTGNIPQVNRRNFGLGISAGPLFDISGGKADTSKFGFFAGPSLRFTPWMFLTPGVHIGEFADFPQGFTHPGQLIPTNTGTPTATKRYTARFAFAITWKIKDLGTSTAQPSGQKATASGKTNKTAQTKTVGQSSQ